MAPAGHGIEPKGRQDKKQFFCAYRARQGAEDQTMVAIDEIDSRLGQCPAGLKFLVVDACRNEPGDKGLAKAPGFDSVTAAPLASGVIAYYSCSAGERSYETEKLGHGVFFHFLLKGLRGEPGHPGGPPADHQDGALVWSSLVDYINREVPTYTATSLRLKQQPDFKGATNSRLPIAFCLVRRQLFNHRGQAGKVAALGRLFPQRLRS